MGELRDSGRVIHSSSVGTWHFTQSRGAMNPGGISAHNQQCEKVLNLGPCNKIVGMIPYMTEA
jgi:hypothetical protein